MTGEQSMEANSDHNMADCPNLSDMSTYSDGVEKMRTEEYPMLKTSLYLDHAAATLCPKTTLDGFHARLLTDLLGNPHSASLSSQRTTLEIEAVRSAALEWFGADPENFDLVFTSNTTAALKLVWEAFQGRPNGFRYAYHADAHTSVVGIRQSATSNRCLETDADVERWLQVLCTDADSHEAQLFAYPAQSNLTGRRLHNQWASKMNRLRSCGYSVYTLLDAASYASTAPLCLNTVQAACDFTVVSLSKIFGFPDLAALIIKKDVFDVFDHRKYFGGGTVDVVTCIKEHWHQSISGPLHGKLEDGTLPFHNIIALGIAMSTHRKLYISMQHVAEHTKVLACRLSAGLRSLRHLNGAPVCRLYHGRFAHYGDLTKQGPIISFNIRDADGRWISNYELEKLASVRDIHVRTGGHCNPGGIAQSLELAPWEIRENFAAGWRCGGQNDIHHGKPTGMIRVSLGAMSTMSDVDRFIAFIREFYIDSDTPVLPLHVHKVRPCLRIESLTVFPVKSCAGWSVPSDRSWTLRREGLAWDREWCIIDRHTGVALSQKRHPRMAMIRPQLDFEHGRLRLHAPDMDRDVEVPLSMDPSQYEVSRRFTSAIICGDKLDAMVYKSPQIASTLSAFLGVACTLARHPQLSASRNPSRQCKLVKSSTSPSIDEATPRGLLLANESPVLVITRASIDQLNEDIKSGNRFGQKPLPNEKRSTGRVIPAAAFRANIVLTHIPDRPDAQAFPYEEDSWACVTIHSAIHLKDSKTTNDTTQKALAQTRSTARLDVLGKCRRCQMVCVDQSTGDRKQEPFSTLAKTRRDDGKVYFGIHTALHIDAGNGAVADEVQIRVGDSVETR